MGSLLLIGLFIGMRHALEADHVAAVASLINNKRSIKQAIKQGSIWGLGHTVTLFLFGSIVIFIDTVLPEQLVTILEFGVGVMLVLLGTDVLWRLIRDKMHFHRHQHSDGEHHIHMHSHAGESKEWHDPSKHEHYHPEGFPIRAMFVGMMHGMAGSAAVILLVLESVSSPMQGMLYILAFGIGSIIGMALLSVAISIPLSMPSKRLTWMHNGLQFVIGTLTLGIGLVVIYQNGSFLVA